VKLPPLGTGAGIRGYNGGMPHTVTRRRAGALLVAAPLAANAQAPAPNRVEGDADLEDVRQQARNNYQAIGLVKIEMTVEPATTFKA
jgi:hypothetical protein